MKTPSRKLENLGSLITVKSDDGEDQCLGHLFHSEEHGTFDPTCGKVPVTKEQAGIHNNLLDQALLDGLDKQCEIGQAGIFYFDRTGRVTTWTGLIVTNDATAVSKTAFVFWRGNRRFRFIFKAKALGQAVFVPPR